MKLFGTRYPPRAAIKLAQDLSLKRGEEEGKLFIARFNAKARVLIGHPEYTHQAIIAFKLNIPAENGLPKEDEKLQLRGIAKQIRAFLERENESLQVGTITRDGTKSYIYYTTNPEAVTAKFAQIREEISSHQISLTIQPDAKWDYFKRYVK